MKLKALMFAALLPGMAVAQTPNALQGEYMLYEDGGVPHLAMHWVDDNARDIWNTLPDNSEVLRCHGELFQQRQAGQLLCLKAMTGRLDCYLAMELQSGQVRPGVICPAE